MTSVVRQRLAGHRLTGRRYRSPVEAVRSMLAVQAQDYAAARWAIGLRTEGADDAVVAAAVDSGEVLRTHVLRPTWHLVPREDARWLVELTGPRLLPGYLRRLAQLEMTPHDVDSAVSVLAETVTREGPLTRSELAARLLEAGINPAGQRMPHLLAVAEARCLLISGPYRGSQNTFAPFTERAAGSMTLDREEALARLAAGYFATRAPATAQDFAWWSGLTLTDARRGMAAAGVDGSAGTEMAPDGSGTVHLLPNFDEYTVAYRDRSAVLPAAIDWAVQRFAYFRDLSPESGVLSNVVIAGGIVAGTWRRAFAGGSVRVEVNLLPGTTGIDTGPAAASYALFTGRELAP